MHDITAMPDIRDDDLIARIEEARGTSAYQFVIIACRQEQHERDAKRRHEEAVNRLPRDARRRFLTRQELQSADPPQGDLRHIHSVLAICGLPYRRLPKDVRDFDRRQGNMALNVSAGFLWTPNGEKVLQPVPFGPKARLVLMHLCSEAIRQKSATIDLAETFTAFVRDLGFSDSGGRKGPLTAFKEQLNALSACTMRIGVWTGGRVRTRTITPIEHIDLWLAPDPSQRSLWPSEVTFSPAMFESLSRHALPVNVKAVRAFAGSARKLDLYFWLGYRLYTTKAKTLIPWASLGQQFGEGYTRPRDFAAAFNADLNDIREVFPKLPVTLDGDGIHLSPAEPDVLALPSVSIKR